MTNGETLETLIMKIERKGMELRYSETEKKFMEELAEIRKTDYDEFLKYFIRYRNLRREFTADFYD